MTLQDEIQDKLAKVILSLKDTILLVSLRLGKTRIALKAIEKGDKVLVVYPDVTIKKSWEAELIKYVPLSTDITFTTKASVHKLINTSWDFLIIDEPQLTMSEKQLHALSTIKYKKRVALSGTLKPQTLKILKAKLNLTVGYTYTIANAIKDKLVKDYKVNVHFTTLDDFVKLPYTKFGKTFYGTEKEIYDYYTEAMTYFKKKEEDGGEDKLKSMLGFKKYMGLRTNLLYNSLALFKQAKILTKKFEKEKMLIYTLRTDIADDLSDFSYHSKKKEDELLESFKEAPNGHAAVVNCVRAGVTIKKLYRVLFHTYESNTEILYQKLGRSLLYEFTEDKSVIDICCLKNTQMETWVNKACESLEQEKIFYIYQGIEYSKNHWIKMNNIGKELYFYNGAVVYRGEDLIDSNQIIKQYRFLDTPDKLYPIADKNLIPL